MNLPGPASGHVARLRVAGVDVVVEPSDEELHGPIRMLFGVFEQLLRTVPADRRAIVGVAGVPGSGKSTLSAFLAFLGMRGFPSLPLAVVSIDGWHWPNAVLGTMPAVGADGETVTMRARKGSPGSFDVDGVVAAMRALRDAHSPARLPAYDRRVHEPVAGRIVVPPGTRLVLLEGNYVLLREPPWQAVAEQLDLAVFIDADLPACREAVIRRHVVGGASRADAERKFEANDAPNTQIVQGTRARADVIVRVGPDHRVLRVDDLQAGRPRR